jgi:hypothetical protein
MSNSSRRIKREFTPEEQERLRRNRESIAAELFDLIVRNQQRHEAAKESTLSGELRRAIHASALSIMVIAQKCGLVVEHLDEFLIGERTLRSDVLDRLAATLDVHLAEKT